MFGFKFAKFEPNTYVFVYKKGKIKKEGQGLAFRYFIRTTSLVVVPLGAIDSPFIFAEVGADFQEITIQGQVSFRISDPQKISQLMDFTMDSKNLVYFSDDSDPFTFAQKVINIVQVITKQEIKNLPLKDALMASDTIAKKVANELASNKELATLGIEILGIAILAIKPNPETAKALEAETREQILKEADEAIFLRRNSAVEQERIIRENELNTDIAVQKKNREIRETKMEAEKSIQLKQQELEKTRLEFDTNQEDKRKQFTQLQVENNRLQSDAKAYATSAIMKVFNDVDPAVIQALATVNMNSDQIIASAFQGLAEKAEKIGELNISSELLQQLIKTKSPAYQEDDVNYNEFEQQIQR